METEEKTKEAMKPRAWELYNGLCRTMSAQVREAWRLCAEAGISPEDMPGTAGRQSDSVCFRDDGDEHVLVHEYYKKGSGYLPVHIYSNFAFAVMAADSVLKKAVRICEKRKNDKS